MTDLQAADDPRRVLLIVHTGRERARTLATAMVTALTGHGLEVHLLPDEAETLGVTGQPGGPRGVHIVDPQTPVGTGCEIAVVLGGDGTLLRAVDITRGSGVPLLGINLGHVGFLAEAEYDDAQRTIAAIVDRAYAHEDRLTLDVRVLRGTETVAHTFALNEASVEKAARERMLEVVVEIDDRPLSRWACDGVVCATPTGSTAYNFSAGGPVVWPSVEALLLVPLSAHALFARALVVAPTSTIAVEVLAHTEGAGVLWCDGRRMVDLPPGARIEISRSPESVRLVRLHEAPFTDRLVAKFDLPVVGWRGAGEERLRDGGGG